MRGRWRITLWQLWYAFVCCLQLDFSKTFFSPSSSSHFWSILHGSISCLLFLLLSFNFFLKKISSTLILLFEIWHLGHHTCTHALTGYMICPSSTALHPLHQGVHPDKGWEFLMACYKGIIWHNDQDRPVTARSPAKEPSPVACSGCFLQNGICSPPLHEVIRK
jgi:hypothetical protein